MIAQKTRAATVLVAALVFLGPPVSANPSLSGDFGRMTDWLSHEVSQGLGFNAGSTFDPPREITDRRLAPDISVGAGAMPLDKTKFPEMQSASLQSVDPQKIFPSSVLFPNFTMHLRGGLPGRFDFGIRFADMTSPPGYKLSSNTTAKAQSNSIGFSLRRHFLGGDDPLVTLGAHFNHVYGRFEFNTKFLIDGIAGFSADTPVAGGLYWNVSSYGLNAVTSQNYGMWTPFMGVGYNYVTGSVRARLQAVPDTDLIDPITGDSSSHPEQNQARAIIGLQMNRSWVNLFGNGEIKAIGIGAGKSWIVHLGMSLPFHIGSANGRYAEKDRAQERRELSAAADKARRARVVSRAAASVPEERPRRELFGGPVKEAVEGAPTMIFIQ